jgi:hypothetical protein
MNKELPLLAKGGLRGVVEQDVKGVRNFSWSKKRTTKNNPL